MKDLPEWEPLAVNVSRGGRQVTTEEQIAYFEHHFEEGDFEEDFRARLKETWRMYAEKDDLESALAYLNEREEHLSRIINEADTLHPSRSGALPGRLTIRDWKELPRDERIDLFEDARAELVEVRFRISVVMNIRRRRALFGDERLFAHAQREAPDPTPDPIRLKDAERLGPLLVEWAAEDGLIHTDDPEADAERLFAGGDGGKVCWTGDQSALIRLFEVLVEVDLMPFDFEPNATLARHFTRDGQPLKSTTLRSQRSQIYERDVRQEDLVRSLVGRLVDAQG